MPTYNDIIKKIDQAIARFQKRIPAIQRAVFADLEEQIKRLDTSNGKIKTTVANLRIINSIKGRLLKIVLSPEYIKDVREFAQAFRDITTLQNQYWRQVEASFKPKTFLKEIRKQAIADTVKNLTASGIGETISAQITKILQTNITTGGSYSQLASQLRNSLLNTAGEGSIQKYTRQITTDAINQYNAQYTQAVSSDLGFEWYSYQGSEIMTSRPFCQAMVENNRYFHISQVPNLLKGLDANGKRLKYVDNFDEEEKEVTIYSKTNLPHGFIPGTNPSNFFVNRAGYFCGHQARPVSEALVPVADREKVYATPAYKRWKALQ